MWFIILGTAFAAAVAGVIYLTVTVSKFGFLRALAGERIRLPYLISFIVLAAAFGLVARVMSVVNAVVVFLHVVLFFLLVGCILRIVRCFSGKDYSVGLQGLLAVALSVIYLAAGYYLLHHVWQTDYSLQTDKPVNLKIALFADSHLSTTFDGDGFAEHMKTIDAQKPDIVLIPGDFVDDWSKKADMLKACDALGKMDAKYGVWYAYGNHDAGFFNNRDFTAAELEQALLDNGIHVLSDDYELVDDRFYVAGRKDSSLGPRKTMDELLDGVDPNKYIIVLDHEPNDYDNEAASAADLVVSGHTHGGQLIPITYVGEWFGINDSTYGHENRNGTDFIVTSGISDWEIQFKTGTKSEYVIIEISQRQ